MASPSSSSTAYPRVPMRSQTLEHPQERPQVQMHIHIPTAATSARSEHIDDVDAAHMRQQDVLIINWSVPQNTSTFTSSRLSPQQQQPLTLPEHSLATSSPVDASVILPFKNTFNPANTTQDGPSQLSDESHSSLTATVPIPSHQDPHRVNQLESLTLPSDYVQRLAQHASLNNINFRPRTNLPVFPNTTDLAAHYGIPKKLPPTPRVQSSINKYQPPLPEFSDSAASQYQNLLSDYIGMLNSKPIETTAPAVLHSPAMRDSSSGVDSSNSHAYQIKPSEQQAVNDLTSLFAGTASANAEMSPSYNWNEFLTSPFLDDESPFEAVLNTPVVALDDFMSPCVADSNSSPLFSDFPLFSQLQAPAVDGLIRYPASKPNTSVEGSSMMTSTGSTTKPATASHFVQPDFENMLTMSPTPETPALEPSSAYSSPLLADVPGSSKLSSQRSKRVATGTRKNITPESLVPIDAPTQARHYLTPSSTSRKDVPAVFARKRSRTEALCDDEEDELAEDASASGSVPTPTEAEAIELKRRQNTLAARRSRKRKLEYQRQLEEDLETTKRELEIWKQRALMVREQLRLIGLPVPFGDS